MEKYTLAQVSKGKKEWIIYDKTQRPLYRIIREAALSGMKMHIIDEKSEEEAAQVQFKKFKVTPQFLVTYNSDREDVLIKRTVMGKYQTIRGNLGYEYGEDTLLLLYLQNGLVIANIDMERFIKGVPECLQVSQREDLLNSVILTAGLLLFYIIDTVRNL